MKGRCQADDALENTGGDLGQVVVYRHQRTLQAIEDAPQGKQIPRFCEFLDMLRQSCFLCFDRIKAIDIGKPVVRHSFS